MANMSNLWYISHVKYNHLDWCCQLVWKIWQARTNLAKQRLQFLLDLTIN